MWNSVENYMARELLVTVYRNFLRNVYSTQHIFFFVQSHKIIDQVVNGDITSVSHGFEVPTDLSNLYVRVERVVDIVEDIFKTSSALSLFENSQLLEIPYSQL